MAPELPPPVSGGVDLAALRDAKLNAKFEFPEIQQAFFLQDGIYVVRPNDPLRLGHVLWGKLAFCDSAHRLLIRWGKLPEVDPRAILIGMRNSLNSLPGKSPSLEGILAKLTLPGEAQAFRFYAKQLGMVGAAKLLLRFVTEDDLLARGVGKGIDEAVQAVSSAARGLTQPDLEQIRVDARRHFGVTHASLALTEGAREPSPFSQERIQQLRRAADAPVDTSTCPQAGTIHEKVSALATACVKARNEAGLRKKLISCRLETKELSAARQLIDQHVRAALPAPEMTASVMTPAQLDAFASRVVDYRRITILRTRWAIGEFLARRILEEARKRGQATNLLVSTTTSQEDEVVRSMLWDSRSDEFHQDVCGQAADQLPRFRPGLDPRILQVATRLLEPELRTREKRLVKGLKGKPLDEVAKKLHDFRDLEALKRLGDRIDSIHASHVRNGSGVKAVMRKLRARIASNQAS